MHAQTLLALLPSVAMAQYGFGKDGSDDSSSSSSAAMTASAAASSSSFNVHVVKVGDGGLTFSPSDIKAVVGDMVEFHFYPKAHSVAQSSFDKPCEPVANSTAAGFFSGPVPVSSGMGTDVFTLEVKDASPKWFYCATGNHCQSGMVGVINAPSSGQRTLEQYAAAAAAKAEKNVTPASTGGSTLAPAASGSPRSGGDSTSASGTSAATGSAASGSAAASSTTTPNAGIETRGDVRWALISFGMAVAGVVGGLVI